MNSEKMLANCIEEYKNGNIIFNTFECSKKCTINEILTQPIDDILDELHQFENLYISNPTARDVNDLAITHIVKTLKQQVQKETESEK